MAEPPVKRRFAHLSKEEIDDKRDSVVPKATKQANQKSARALKAYLLEKGISTPLDSLEPEDLAKTLETFYFDARTQNGDLYKRSSLENLRHGVNRYLRSPPINKEFDIIKDAVFRKANDNFRAALNELKSEGKGDTEHYPAISDEDLKKLYSSEELNVSYPRGLFNKVQFDIRYYFCRRGQENIRCMNKDNFKVDTDSTTGRRYVVKARDELTKNHRGDDSSSFSGFMPERPGCPDCPVTSFEKYLSHLHPDCNALWQRPKEYSDVQMSNIWYYNAPVGEKTLRVFMKTLSTRAGLSRQYTNHSCRTTGATVLSKYGFQPAQVMSVTGHKSVNSLTQYQHVSSEEKIVMGAAMSSALEGRQNLRLGPRVRPASVMGSSGTTSSSTAMQPLHASSSATHWQSAVQQLASQPQPTRHIMPTVGSVIPSPSFQSGTATSSATPQLLPRPERVLPIIMPLQNVQTSNNVSTAASSVINFDLTSADIEELFSPFFQVEQPARSTQSQAKQPVFNNCTFTGNVSFNLPQ